jgi:hypothetical protein
MSMGIAEAQDRVLDELLPESELVRLIEAQSAARTRDKRFTEAESA